MTLDMLRTKFLTNYTVATHITLSTINEDADDVVAVIAELTEDLSLALTTFETLLEENESNAGSVDAFMLVSGVEADDASELEELLSSFQEAFIGDMSVLDYAHQYVEDSDILEGVSTTFAQYFDYEAFANDLELGGDVVEQDGFLFRTTW
jgi:hypothetical protein